MCFARSQYIEQGKTMNTTNTLDYTRSISLRKKSTKQDTVEDLRPNTASHKNKTLSESNKPIPEQFEDGESPKLTSFDLENEARQSLVQTDMRPDITAHAKHISVPVLLATKTRAYLRLNYQVVGVVRSWRKAKWFWLKATTGDIISVMSRGRRRDHGVIAYIAQGKRSENRFFTGGDGFRAKSYRLMNSYERAKFRSRGSKMCSWKSPVILKKQRRGRYAKKFPFRTGARYVWAFRALKKEWIVMRFVVGGENCSGGNGGDLKPTKKPSPLPNNHDSGKRCACRILRGKQKGRCFEFRNNKFTALPNVKAPCFRRKCDVKFECVKLGRRSRTLCVRRFARFEAVVDGNVFAGRCVNRRLRHPKPYYVPYARLKKI